MDFWRLQFLYNLLSEMFFVARGRRSRALVVLIVAVYFALFAVCLKASPGESTHSASSGIKFWADPDRAFDKEIQTTPIVCILIILLSALTAAQVEGRIPGVFANDVAPPKIFLRSPNWRRPPPLC